MGGHESVSQEGAGEVTHKRPGDNTFKQGKTRGSTVTSTREAGVTEGKRSRITRGEWYFLIGVVVVSLALRIAYHYEMRGNPLVENLQLDEQFHDRWAKSIAAGDIIGEGVFFRAPLYPYLLGFSYWLFGPTADTPRLFQHVLGSGIILLVYILARSLFGRRSAIVASLLGAFYTVMICFEGRLLFDLPLTFLVLLWLTHATLYTDKPAWTPYAFSGFLFGLVCIMRPTFLALAPFLFGFVVRTQLTGRHGILRSAIVLVAAFLIPVAAVTVRNVMAGGDFVLIASQGGINFYIGNNPQSDGMSSWVPEAGEVWGQSREVEYIAEQAMGRQLRPSEVSAYWYEKGQEFLLNEPVAFLGLLLKKAYLFWSHIEISNNLSYYLFERASLLLGILPVGFWLVGPLGLAGAILARKDRHARLFLLFIVLYFLVTIFFFVADRFRLPVIPVLCIFAGYAVDFIIHSAAVRNWSSLARTVALVASGALIVNTNFAQLPPQLTFGEEGVQGQAALQSGDLVKAVELLERAVDREPGNSSVHINLGVALWGMGKTEEAAEALRSGMRGNPYPASINLAHLFFNLQQMDSASMYAESAIKARPFAPGGYVIAAKIALVKHDNRRAEEILLAGLNACRDNFVYGEYLLAGIQIQSGNVAAAEAIYRRVLAHTGRSRQPDYALGSEKEQFGEDLQTLHAKTLQGLGRVFAENGKRDSSEAYLRSSAALLPAKGDVWADWGVSLLRLNRLDEADTVMRRAVSLNPGNPGIWFNYATLLARKGEIDRARQALVQALALKPDFEEARRLMQALTGTPKH